LENTRAVLTALYPPGQSNAIGPLPTQPLTGIKLNVDKIKHIFIIVSSTVFGEFDGDAILCQEIATFTEHMVLLPILV
jgi:hypothetical protein